MDLKIASPSAYPLPNPNPIPNHTGNCLLLKNNIDANTPPPKPKPVLIKALDNTTSHLSLSKFCDEVGMIWEAGVDEVGAEVDDADAVVLDMIYICDYFVRLLKENVIRFSQLYVYAIVQLP